MGITTAAGEQEEPCEDSSVTPQKGFTGMFDMEPRDVQEKDKVGVGSSDLLGYSEGAEDSRAEESGAGLPEKEPDPASTEINTDLKTPHTLNHAQEEEDIKAAKTSLKCYYLKRPKSNVCQVADSLVENPFTSMSKDLEEEQSTSAKLSGADWAEGAGEGPAEEAGGGNKEEAREGPKHSEEPERREDATLLEGQSESKLPVSLEDTMLTQGQVGFFFNNSS